jgi:pyrophosphatase PpaX
MEGLLATLKHQGRRLGVVTAKRRATVELAFARIPLAHNFDTLVGGDETLHHKPHPEPLLLALDRLAASPDEGAYVGDSPYDMQAANAAGMYAIGVTWGRIHDRDALADADVIVDTAEELLAQL